MRRLDVKRRALVPSRRAAQYQGPSEETETGPLRTQPVVLSLDFPEDPDPSLLPPPAKKKVRLDSVESADSGAQTQYFSVVWAKCSTRKHKKWEGDGFLVCRGRTATLLSLDGQSLAKSSGFKFEELEKLSESSILLVSGKELEVQERMSEEAVMALVSEPSSPPVPSEMPAAQWKPFVQPMTSAENLHGCRSVLEKPLFDAESPEAFVLPAPPASSDSVVPIVPVRFPALVIGDMSQVVVDPRLSKHLRPHQKQGVCFLYECLTGMREGVSNGCILADEMGLGKSLQTIALIWTLLKQGPFGRRPLLRKILLVCPSSLVQNWVAEFRKWLGDERLQPFALSKTSQLKQWQELWRLRPVLAMSYDMALRCDAETMRSLGLDLMVCDEAHRLRNPGTKINLFLTELEIPRRLLLTGTPIQNDLQELYALMELASPGLLGTQAEYRRDFEEPIGCGRQKDASEEEREMGETAAAELQTRTQLCLLRRTAEVNLQYLPPKADYVLFCRPSDFQQNLFERLLVSEWAAEDSTFARIDALRKLCNHPALLYHASKEPEASSLLKSFADKFPEGYSDGGITVDQSGKMSVLCDLLESLRMMKSSGKVVVVSNFVMTLNMVEDLCRSCGYPTLRLDGQTPSSQRQDLVRRFNSAHDSTFVFLLSSKAGGVGLNLTGASRIILFDVDWNPANDLQAMARVWRDGQKAICHIYRLVTTGTLEERMLQRQMKKQGLSGAVVDSAASEGNATFSPGELKDLFTVDPHTDCLTHDLMGCRCVDDSAPTTPPPETSKSLISMADWWEWEHLSVRAENLKRLPETCGLRTSRWTSSALSFIFFHLSDNRQLSSE